MPINGRRFEKMDDSDGPTPGTNAAEILRFLRNHPDKAYTQTEIAEATDVKRGSVGPTLVRLRDRGRVDHRGNYWRVSDHERSVDAAVGHSSAVVAAREEGGETPVKADWDEYAVDPREQRDG